MRYLPKSPSERQEMLAAIGVRSIEDLFKSIPEKFRLREPLHLPGALSEAEIIQYFQARAAENARRHGLRVPALHDPAMTKSIGELARKLAGPTADAQRFEAACQLVAAQIDLLRIRQARLPLLSRVIEDRTAVRSLTTLDLYERYARSRRNSAMRQFSSAPAPVGVTSGQAIPSEASSNEIDIAAVLREIPVQKTVRSREFPIKLMRRHPRLGRGLRATSLRFCANEAKRCANEPNRKKPR